MSDIARGSEAGAGGTLARKGTDFYGHVNDAHKASKAKIQESIQRIEKGIETGKGVGKDSSELGAKVMPNVKVNFKSGYDTHLITVEGFKAKPTIGIKGGHNLANFEKYILDNFGDQVKDINQAVTKTPHPDIQGIYEIKYKLPVYDGMSTANGGKGNFTGQWKEYKNPKTVFDPRIFSDEQILKLGREAMEEGVSSNRIIIGSTRSPSDMVEGYANINGKKLKFMGFKDKVTGEITNFFPVLN
ncbi:EndoU domain-containing protein [Bacillus sp. FSL W8-0848]|uniref:EndoU domain-containing protein n=1 Tax=Bacillus sp. FSL W8-0848 TaxID=2954634 RepID=UPI0030F9D101